MRSRAAPWFRAPTPQWQCVAALQGILGPLTFERWREYWRAAFPEVYR